MRFSTDFAQCGLIKLQSSEKHQYIYFKITCKTRRTPARKIPSVTNFWPNYNNIWNHQLEEIIINLKVSGKILKNKQKLQHKRRQSPFKEAKP